MNLNLEQFIKVLGFRLPSESVTQSNLNYQRVKSKHVGLESSKPFLTLGVCGHCVKNYFSYLKRRYNVAELGEDERRLL